MQTNTISFDTLKVYKNKIFCAKYGNNSVYTKVFDISGNTILERISYKPKKYIEGDKIIISRKNQYQTTDKQIIFETIQRIYDKFGKLINVKREQL